jgi:hypothetical protein
MKKISVIVSALAMIVMFSSCGEEEKKGIINKDKVKEMKNEAKSKAKHVKKEVNEVAEDVKEGAEDIADELKK